ncbi:MAG: hypothetical protein LWW83_14090 [Azonexaceae bacterium]|nr:hypothetical protein [Azonexaceae bacterium]
MFTGNQREAFLSFLRNLTPQIAFLTLAFISASLLDGTWKFDWEGFRNVLPMLMSVFVFLGATIANISQFIDAVAASTPEMCEASKAIKARWPAGPRQSCELLVASWKHNKPAMLNFLVAMIVAETALVLVFLAAYQGGVASHWAR